MTIQEALKEKDMSIYRLAKTSAVPYATVNDICNGKAKLEKCSAETIYRLARALDVSMEDLLAPRFYPFHAQGKEGRDRSVEREQTGADNSATR